MRGTWLVGLALLAVACGATGNEAPSPAASGTGGAPAAAATGRVLDATTAMSLAAMPLACIDRPHGASSSTGYLHERSLRLRPDYERTRAFYGCYDWHSAVNSTWAMVALLRRHPDLPVAPLLIEKLQQHLATAALEGEAAFFAAEGNATFERPYGWAWFLALHGELTRLESPHATAWVENTAPLAERFAEGLVDYFDKLDYPNRVGTHANTAFALDLALEFARATGREALGTRLVDTAVRLFGADRDCPLEYEPSASDFLSPCLMEGTLMAAALEPERRAAWLADFLPAVDADVWQRLQAPIQLGSSELELDLALGGARSHLIGLAFTRAEALVRLAGALAPNDPRASRLRDLAEIQGRQGFEAMFEADYLGSHWIGTFALRYLIAAEAR